MDVDCIGCGKCCNNKWVVKLTSQKEINMFGDSVVFGNYMWTNECQFLVDNKYSIHE